MHKLAQCRDAGCQAVKEPNLPAHVTWPHQGKHLTVDLIAVRSRAAHAGFSIEAVRGSRLGHIEADLLYFAGGLHDVKAGEPMVLVECKRLIKDDKELQAAAAQVRSYTLWVIPAYYVITDAKS